MLKKKLGAEAIEGDWSWCTGLADCFKVSPILIIPESCERIGDCAFGSLMGLGKVIIPKSVKEIGEMAFIDCWRLKKVEIPESVEVIRRAAFCNCKNATITLKRLKKSFGEIDDSAFVGCKDVKEEIRN